MANLAAVLFDMDGTLVDSEIIWEEFLRSECAKRGVLIDQQTREKMRGASRDFTANLMVELGTVKDLAGGYEFYAIVAKQVAQRIAEAPPFEPGAQELVHALHEAGIKIAIVSASPRGVIEPVADALGVVDLVVSGEDSELGKPWPDPYELALHKFRVGRANAVVLEDSINGVAAARGGGIAAIQISRQRAFATDPGILVVPAIAAVDQPLIEAWLDSCRRRAVVG